MRMPPLHQLFAGLAAIAASLPALAQSPPLSAASWNLLQKSSWIAEGVASPRHVIYLLVDPNCPYCHDLWLQLEPRLKDGIQVRVILLGIISPTSSGKAAAILQSRNPARAWRENESRWRAAGGDMDSGGIAPAAAITPQAQAELEKNQDLITQLPFAGTPALFYRDPSGRSYQIDGVPSAARLDAALADAGA